MQAKIKSDWQKTKVAADRALADLKAEIDSCVLQGMSSHLHCLLLDIILSSIVQTI